MATIKVCDRCGSRVFDSDNVKMMSVYVSEGMFLTSLRRDVLELCPKCYNDMLTFMGVDRNETEVQD